jgi:hypothetical protein
MNEDDVRRFVGKKCLLILNNNFKYTGIIPEFSGPSFLMTDKYGRVVLIECSFIGMIREDEE